MKVLIPVAGMGTRLAPHTHTIPKALIQVAGKPMLAHTLDYLSKYDNITEVIFIIGYLGEQIQEFVESHYDYQCRFIEQTEMLGLGHAVHMAAPVCRDESLLIILGDTLFSEGSEPVVCDGEWQGSICVKSVEDPRRFGIVETDNLKITRFVEKPDKPKSNQAIIGVYYFSESRPLFDSLSYIISNNIRTKGEFQLTDALSHMLENGYRFKISPVDGWYDCGKPETLLETNQVLLEITDSINLGTYENCVFIEPVAICENAIVKNSIIGPYVSIGKGTCIENSIIKNSIINREATIKNQILSDSLIGASAQVISQFRQLNVGDSSEIIMK